MPVKTPRLEPGMRVSVTQQMPQKDDVWTDTVEGIVVTCRQARTGSWFAHAKDDQLWLDRMDLELDDGEIVTLNLDQYSVVTVLSDPNARSDEANEESDSKATEAGADEQQSA